MSFEEALSALGLDERSPRFMSMAQGRDELSRDIRPGCVYGPDPVSIVKQPTYLGTTSHVRVGFVERAPRSDYIGPPHVWVESPERFEKGRGETIDPVRLSTKGLNSSVGVRDFVPPSDYLGVPMSQCSHVALNPGEAPTVRDTTLCSPEPQGQTPNLLDFDPLTTQDSTPSNPMPTGPAPSARPGCQSSDSQPVYSQGVTPESRDVGQGQQYDRPVQAVDLKPQVPPTQNPTFPDAQSQLSGGHQDDRYSPGPFVMGGCSDYRPSSYPVPVPEVPSQPCHFGGEGGGRMAHTYEPPTTERHFNVSHAQIPAASQCPSDYARIPAAYIHPPEYSWRPAAAYGLPRDVQTPAARYNLQEFVAPPTSYHNPTAWSRPRYKDLHFDGRSSWKAFLLKFVRLSRSQRWTETEQHDQFCFFLEGTASEYYTLLLETSPDLCFADILRKFDKRFGSAVPDLANQLNFQSAVQNSGESLRQWSDRVLTLATRAFPQLPDVHSQAIPRLCNGAEAGRQGCMPWMASPRLLMRL